MKKLLYIIIMIILFIPIFISAKEEKVYDNADIFSIKEENIINNKLNKYVTDYNMDIVVLTTLINTNEDTYDYVKNFVKENSFGIGKYNSGIVFIIDKDNNKNIYYLFGDAQKYFDSKREKEIKSYINKMYNSTNKNYYVLTTSFIDKIDFYTKQGIPKSNINKYIDASGLLKEKHDYPILFSIFSSLVLSILSTSIILYILTKEKNKAKMEYRSIINYDIKDDVLINSKEI